MLEIKNESAEMPIKIKVIGVGGGGNNAVNRMVEDGIGGVEFIGVNTDNQDLSNCKAQTHIQIGKKLTRGLGAGSNPDVGRDSAEEDYEEIVSEVKGSNMVFVTCGMGGGTGTGAAPVIARAAREQGILTVGVVTTPFLFEGRKKMQNAQNGIEELKKNVDSYIIISNQKLSENSEEELSVESAFDIADDVLKKAIQGIVEIITTAGTINTDFADVKRTIFDSGEAYIGMGNATGEGRAKKAVEMAISNPIVETNVANSKNVLINIKGKDVKLNEMELVCETVREIIENDNGLDDDNIIPGIIKDESVEGISVFIIAAGGRNVPSMRLGQTSYSSGVPKYISNMPSTGDTGKLDIPGLNQPKAPVVKESDGISIPEFLKGNR